MGAFAAAFAPAFAPESAAEIAEITSAGSFLRFNWIPAGFGG
jgi:hypothetical protein